MKMSRFFSKRRTNKASKLNYTSNEFKRRNFMGMDILKLKGKGISDVAVLDKLIGQGAFGKVYQATLNMPILAPNGTTIQVGTMVAIKEIQLHDTTNYESLSREIRALKTAMAGNCTDVNQIYDVLYNAPLKKIYFILEFIDGIDVFVLMNQQGLAWFQALSEEQMMNSFVDPVMTGLRCLHQNGIAHRDVKVENMMLDVITNKTKLIDLGLSCIKECHGFVGTLMTLSPEVINGTIGSDLDEWARADYWSLGCSIYYLLTFKDYPIQLRIVDAYETQTQFYEQEGTLELEAIDVRKYPKIKSLLQNLLQITPKSRKMNY